MADRTMGERLRDEKGVVGEALRHLVSYRRLGDLPRGDGHPVLVLPAYSVSDRGTWPLRRVLERLDYPTYGWELGANRGATPEMVEALGRRFEAIHDRHMEPVSLVGWSLGGVFARAIARRRPDKVRRVITLGSPYRAIEAERGWTAPPVPTTSIYSPTDGLVPPHNATEEEVPGRENIEVRGTHSGLALNVEVIEIVADRLARPL